MSANKGVISPNPLNSVGYGRPNPNSAVATKAHILSC